MKYQKIKINDQDSTLFINLLRAKIIADLLPGVPKDEQGVQTLSANYTSLPNFYFFPEINGDQYVLQHNMNKKIESYDCFKVLEVDLDTERPCEVVLRALTREWPQDDKITLKKYGVKANPVIADSNATNVRIWCQYWTQDTEYLFDNYVMRHEVVGGFDVMAPIDFYNGDDSLFKDYVFASYAEAKDWIAKQEAEWVADEDEKEPPMYFVVD